MTHINGFWGMALIAKIHVLHTNQCPFVSQPLHGHFLSLLLLILAIKNVISRPLTFAGMSVVVSNAYDIDTNEIQHLCSKILLRSDDSSFTPFFDPVTGFCSYGSSASGCSNHRRENNGIQYRRFCPCSIIGEILRFESILLVSIIGLLLCSC